MHTWSAPGWTRSRTSTTRSGWGGESIRRPAAGPPGALAFVSADIAKAQVDNTVKPRGSSTPPGRQGHTIGIGAGARPGAGQAPQ
ncbi:hypothetical protein ACFQV4_25615 [Streptomyces thermocarboxydus]